MSISIIKQSVDAFVANLEAVQHASSQDKKSNLVQKVQEVFIHLVSQTSEAAEELSRNINTEQQELMTTTREYTNLCKKATALDSEIEEAQSKLKRYEREVEDVSREIREAGSEISSLRRRIEEEDTKRVDAATDWIPLVGLIGGLVTGAT